MEEAKVQKSGFEVRRELDKAVEGQRYFVAIITFNSSEGKFDYHYTQEKFPSEEVLPGLKKIGNMFAERVVGDE